MQKLGWVHRDVNIRNLHLHEGVGMISDLEYSRDMDDSGTVPETSEPVSHPYYLFIHLTFLFVPEDSDTEEEITQADEVMIRVPPKLKHHSLHDAESLWWCLIWFLRRHFPQPVRTERFGLVLLNRLTQLGRSSPPGVKEQWLFAGAWYQRLRQRYTQYEKRLPKSVDSSALWGAHDFVADMIDEHGEEYPAALTTALPKNVLRVPRIRYL